MCAIRQQQPGCGARYIPSFASVLLSTQNIPYMRIAMHLIPGFLSTLASPVPVMVDRPMPSSIQWGAATILRGDWRRRSCFQPGCLPHCCRRTLHQQAEGPPDWGNNLAAHPHAALMQCREWLRPCFDANSQVLSNGSQFVNVHSCKAGQVRSSWRVHQWTKRGEGEGEAPQR